MRIQRAFIILTVIALCCFSCNNDDGQESSIELISATLNGIKLEDGADDLPAEASIIMVFSSTLDPVRFNSEFSISYGSDDIDADPVFSSQSTRVTIETVLEYKTTYTIRIGTGPIGKNGERLSEEVSISFSTRDDGIIHSMPPCTEGSDACLQSVSLTGNGTDNFHFYASFPVYEEMAEWSDIRAALIVVHGASRNPDDYFNYVMTSLQAENLEEEVVLIAPFYKNEPEALNGDLYWSGTSWREGDNSVSTEKVSSYTSLDLIIDQLADKTHFPVLEKIIVTGQSSGGCFTHLYAAANKAEGKYPEISFEYIVGESQYFYYPDGRRIDESTSQLYTPAGCAGYDIWPIGYDVIPPYLNSTTRDEFNNRFVNRSIIYLLGNGNEIDGSLNTTDCYATLLGSTRYMRGKNMFRYMELVYPGTHNHRVVEVEGVTHDGSAIYQSSEFRNLLNELLGL